jgi:hypothetical protein
MYMPAHLKSREYQIKMINYPEWERVVIYFLQNPIWPTRAQEDGLSQRKNKGKILRGGRHKTFHKSHKYLNLKQYLQRGNSFLYLLKQFPPPRRLGSHDNYKSEFQFRKINLSALRKLHISRITNDCLHD